ncbi:hypothetical protein OG301_13955 [Streptomyces platensis]|nr:hypothetical protein OG301_13955 [Streptomyces platensis]
MRKHSAWIFELLLRVLLPARGRALWLAVHGHDAGPYWIHGVEVTAG